MTRIQLTTPIPIPGEFVELCGYWHGGQWSVFYSVSSTGKAWFSREDILPEIAHNRALAAEVEDFEDAATLDRFAQWVLDNVPSEEEIFAEFTDMDREDMLFDDAVSEWLMSGQQIADWWADNQGRYV